MPLQIMIVLDVFDLETAQAIHFSLTVVLKIYSIEYIFPLILRYGSLYCCWGGVGTRPLLSRYSKKLAQYLERNAH